MRPRHTVSAGVYAALLYGPLCAATAHGERVVRGGQADRKEPASSGGDGGMTGAATARLSGRKHAAVCFSFELPGDVPSLEPTLGTVEGQAAGVGRAKRRNLSVSSAAPPLLGNSGFLSVGGVSRLKRRVSIGGVNALRFTFACY